MSMLRLQSAARLGGMLAAAAFLASCAGGSEAPPVGEPPSVRLPATQDQRAVDDFADRPCDLLQPAQLAALGLENVALGNAQPAAPSEPWSCGATRSVLGQEPDDVQWAVFYRFDVTADLEQRTAPPRRVRPLAVEGLPAALLEDITSFYRCSFAARTGPGQGVAVQVRRDREEIADTCTVAQRVGEEIVRSLPRSTA